LNTTPLPAQGTRFEFYFASTVVPPIAAGYLVDVNAAPAGCSTAWTAVSANTSAVQLSPAGGTSRGQVELFIPANSGASRATSVTIAGQVATITQSGQ
jgi:hypothetical protein